MTWDQVRFAERFGVRFGPSTVTHPVIARVEDGVAEWEIRQSWLRVRTETIRPLPIFCYPNGLRNDSASGAAADSARRFLGAVTARRDTWPAAAGRARREVLNSVQWS
jgi:hypothetical protein